jgi:hypothetical protein
MMPRRCVCVRKRFTRARLGRKGRRYRAWARRYQRLERDFRAWDVRMAAWLRGAPLKRT